MPPVLTMRSASTDGGGFRLPQRSSSRGADPHLPNRGAGAVRPTGPRRRLAGQRRRHLATMALQMGGGGAMHRLQTTGAMPMQMMPQQALSPELRAAGRGGGGAGGAGRRRAELRAPGAADVNRRKEDPSLRDGAAACFTLEVHGATVRAACWDGRGAKPLPFDAQKTGACPATLKIDDASQFIKWTRKKPSQRAAEPHPRRREGRGAGPRRDPRARRVARRGRWPPVHDDRGVRLRRRQGGLLRLGRREGRAASRRGAPLREAGSARRRSSSSGPCGVVQLSRRPRRARPGAWLCVGRSRPSTAPRRRSSAPVAALWARQGAPGRRGPRPSTALRAAWSAST